MTWMEREKSRDGSLKNGGFLMKILLFSPALQDILSIFEGG
jgi:hypothetical protein